jgi:hypothetical protein
MDIDLERGVDLVLALGPGDGFQCLDRVDSGR